VTDMKNTIGYHNLPRTNGHDGSMDKDHAMRWKAIMGALTFEGRLDVPEALFNQVKSPFSDNPESVNFEAIQITQLVFREFYWQLLDTTAREYIVGGAVCNQIYAPRHEPYGTTVL